MGIDKQARPIRRFAKNRTPKNAVDAPTWPDGNAWYFGLKRAPFQTSSVLTDGRARPLPFLLFQFFKLLRRQRRFHPIDELIMGLFQLIFPRRFILPFVLLAKLISFLLSRQDKSMDFRCLICSDVKLFCTTGDQR